ncbi:beta-microseminoprotein [Vipera latastei]
MRRARGFRQSAGAVRENVRTGGRATEEAKNPEGHQAPAGGWLAAGVSGVMLFGISLSTSGGCFQNGKWYRVPAVWKTNNCQRCECKPKELICCSLVFRPINYDKKKCIAMFHRQSCSIRVVKKNDPTESCHVFAGVG